MHYIDDLVLRDRDSDGDGVAGDGSLGKTNSGLDERLFAMQDANWNVVALGDTNGAVQERYEYLAYGVPCALTSGFGWHGASSYAWDTLYTGRQYDAETLQSGNGAPTIIAPDTTVPTSEGSSEGIQSGIRAG